MNFRAALRVIDFFIPVDVATSVFVVFALENAVSYYLEPLIPQTQVGPVWLLIALLAMLLLNVASADEEEMDELEEDLDDVLD